MSFSTIQLEPQVRIKCYKLEALIDELQVIYYDYDMDIRGTCPRTNWDDLEQGEAIGWHKALEQVISELEEIKEEYEK